MSRTFEYGPAVRRASPLFIGIMGPSGGGKTWSALRLATGIQRIVGGDVAVVDTEADRALKCADFFAFNHLPFKAPFRSLDYLECAEFVVSKGAKTVIFDSMSHEHTGVGGYLATADAELDRMAGDNYGKRQACKLASFIKPSSERRKMIDGFLTMSVNFIFNFRAKEKVKPIKNQGKTEIENIGFMPIGSSELVFEMDACCLLMPHAGGVPTWISDEMGEKMMIKSAKQFEHIFATKQPLSEDIGQQLAEWARGGAATTAEDPILATLRVTGEESAKGGVESLKTFWTSLSRPHQHALKNMLPSWKAISEAVAAQ